MSVILRAIAAVLAVALTSNGAAAEVMRGFGSGMSAPSDSDILIKLQAIYAEKLKPLEKKSRCAISLQRSC